jgi:hypothetical protein
MVDTNFMFFESVDDMFPIIKPIMRKRILAVDRASGFSTSTLTLDGLFPTTAHEWLNIATHNAHQM